MFTVDVSGLGVSPAGVTVTNPGWSGWTAATFSETADDSAGTCSSNRYGRPGASGTPNFRVSDIRNGETGWNTSPPGKGIGGEGVGSGLSAAARISNARAAMAPMWGDNDAPGQPVASGWDGLSLW